MGRVDDYYKGMQELRNKVDEQAQKINELEFEVQKMKMEFGDKIIDLQMDVEMIKRAGGSR